MRPRQVVARDTVLEVAARGRGVRGFTMIEMLIVVVVVGIMFTVALPFIRTGLVKSSVSGAMSAIAALHAAARNAAILRGRTAVLVLDGANARVSVIVRRPGSSAVDTLGRVESLASRFSVTFATTRDSILFTPRGIGSATTNTTVIVSRSGVADTLTISAAGRLLR